MARTRYQRPDLKRDDVNKRFVGRYRKDVLQKDGTVKRIRPKVFFPYADYMATAGKEKGKPSIILAQKAFDLILAPINSVTAKPKREATFGEFAQTWVDTILIHRALTTQASEKQHLKNYLLPAFGDRALATIDTEAVQAWVSAQTGKMDPVYLDHIYATLRNVLRIAKRDKYIESNPCSADIVLPTRPPKGQGTYAYTIEDYQAMRAHMNERDRLIFGVQAETGIRPGEVAALKVDCLSYNETGIPILTVRENYVDIEGGSFKPTKNGKERFFALSPELDEELRRYLQARRRTSGLIFTNRNGRPLDKSNFNRMLREVARKAGVLDKVKALGIEKLGTYPLRRLVSTEADGVNLPSKTRAERMGHTPEMFGVYAKRIEEADVQFAKTMSAKLRHDPVAAPLAPAPQPSLRELLANLTPEAEASLVQLLIASRVQNSRVQNSGPASDGPQKGPFGAENGAKTASKQPSTNGLGLFWTPIGPDGGLTN